MRKTALILIVEDNAVMRDGLHATLDVVDFGYELSTLTAANGLDALKQLQTNMPDLIISDIAMPGLNGFELLTEVRSNPAWSHIPFIFLSARKKQTDVLQGRLSGADRYITKPFSLDELESLIRSQLDRGFQLREQHYRDMKQLQSSILQLLNHEFRTPLTYVTAYYEMLADGQDKPNRRNFRKYLHGIQTGSVRLAHLTEDLMRVLDLRSGEAALLFEQQARAVDTLPALIQAGIAKGKARNAECPVLIASFVPTTLPPIYGNQQDLLDIVTHVVDNAVKFAHYNHRSHGRVEVTAYAEDDLVYIKIEDNGPGFPEEIIPQLFDIFFQYNRSQFEQQGTGIGLSIAKGLLDLHHGTLDVKSKVGEGSCFTITLPVLQHGRLPASIDSESKPQRKAKILIVEDDPILLIGLEELFGLAASKYQFDVATTTNGREALEIIPTFHPDLILSDILMPELDGYALLRTVRENPDWVSIPILFLTAKVKPEEQHSGLISGAEEYITKPYHSRELLTLVEKQLDRYFARRQAQETDLNLLIHNILTFLPAALLDPLNSVNEYSQRLSSLPDINREAELKETLQGIQVDSIELTNLVEDFIVLVELLTGEAEYTYRHRSGLILDAAIIPRDTYRRLINQTAQLDANVQQPPASQLSPIWGDLAMLTQSLQRLAQVGLHFHPCGEEFSIRLSSSSSDTDVVFTLQYGYGLETAVANTIHTVLANPTPENTRLAEFAPSLVIAAGYVALHGGRIEFKHTAPEAFTFSILLPIYNKSNKIA